ncbi:MAG: hypothetical protein EA403_15635 [Spirochaetaceae bacterium]|nr:MAG: hypothetical protein EA403_15635 [Spirochaetaceae bacterium]
MKQSILMTIALFGIALSAMATEPIGHVVYLAGDPHAVRSARPLWLGIGLGMPVHHMDFFHTAADEMIEIETSDAAGVLASIRVQPESVLYLAIVHHRSAQEIRLLSGSVTVAMRDPQPDAVLSVVTERATVDSAGAEYDVTVAADGSVLFTVRRGTARVTHRDGRRLFADAERAVEALPDGVFRTAPMQVDRGERFRSVWLSQVDARLRIDAGAVYRRVAEAYRDVAARFHDSYRELLLRRDILDRWMETDRQGRDPLGTTERGEAAAEREAIAMLLEPAAADVRELEALWYRILYLARLSAAGVGPDSLVEPRLTAHEFFDERGAEARVIEDQMHTVRSVIRLLAQRTGGTGE